MVYGTMIDGWFLPDSGTLQTIYDNLYKEGKIDCEPDVYWSSTLNNSDNTHYIAINFFDGQVDAANPWFMALVLPVRRVSEEEVIAFIKGQAKD
jgi:hypothetical protein